LVIRASNPHLKTEMYWIHDSHTGIASRLAKYPPKSMKGMMAIGAMAVAISALESRQPRKRPIEPAVKLSAKLAR